MGGYYEPKVARHVFGEMIAEQKTLSLFMRYRFVSAVTVVAGGAQTRLAAARFTNLADGGEVEFGARVFIDASYEGDLLAAAGVPYVVGREGRKEYGELFAGRKYYQNGRFLPGSSGEGDKHVQCYNFRITMTNSPENRIAVRKPEGYRREDFLPLLGWIKSGVVKRVAEDVVRFRYIPNGKADVNDVMHAPFSLRILGINDDWPEGSPEVRQKIFNRFKTHSLGLFWFLANDQEVPESIRQEAAEWGLPKDEFPETAHFPALLYVREGRRMKGEFVFVESHTQPEHHLGSVRAPLFIDAVAAGDYSLDSHGETPVANYHPGVTDGSYGFPTVPFQIPYRIMLPPNVEGLLVPVAVSASHVGYSAVRMEPTWAALGQAAGLAAALALQTGTEVRGIDVARLQEMLHERRAITIYFGDITPESPHFRVVQYFGNRGFFHDVIDAKEASWAMGKHIPGTQWRGAAPNHDAGLELVLTPEQRGKWMRRAGIADDALPGAGATRIEFLTALYHIMKGARQ
jgi:hypothetical protein